MFHYPKRPVDGAEREGIVMPSHVGGFVSFFYVQLGICWEVCFLDNLLGPVELDEPHLCSGRAVLFCSDMQQKYMVACGCMLWIWDVIMAACLDV